MEFAEVGVVLAFFGGFMAIVLGINYGFRWTNRKFPSDAKLTEQLGAMEQRVIDLEERLDFTERMLADVRSHQELPPKC